MKPRLLIAVSLLVLLLGCEQEDGFGGTADTTGTSETTASADSVEVALEPVSDSGVSGKVLVKEIEAGIQLELKASGLPTPGSSYLAQAHSGECADLQGEGDGEHGEDHGSDKHEHGAAGPAATFARLDVRLVKRPEMEAHGGHENAPDPSELPGDMDQPIEFLASADGTAAVTTLLQGASLDRLLSGEPKYVDLHASNSEEAAPLACADLDRAEG